MNYQRMMDGWNRAQRKFVKQNPVKSDGARPPHLTPDEARQIEQSRRRHANDPVTVFSNLSGRTYGKLLVWQQSYAQYWWCLCVCGSFAAKPIHSMRLIQGKVKDCGCVETERKRLVRFRARKKAEWGW